MVKTLKIAIILAAGENWMGGIIYIQNLIKAIAALKKEEIELYLLVGSEQQSSFYEGMGPLVKEICLVDFLNVNLNNRLRWKIGSFIPSLEDRRLVNFVKQKQIDFVYPVPLFAGISWDFSGDWVNWIPDFQHKYLPELFSQKEIKAREKMFARIIAKNSQVVFSSQTASDDFSTFYPQAKLDKYLLRFRSIPEEDWFADNDLPQKISDKYNLPQDFFLVSNQFWQHKNHKLILESLILLKQKNIHPAIVCTGKPVDPRLPEYIEEIKTTIAQYQLEKQFIILGLIPRQEQIQLMRRCLAVIQPSLFEGWSTVVEDARLLGKTILLSDFPVHLEQNPPKVVFFQRQSATEMAERLETILPNLRSGPDLIAESESRMKNQLECQIYAEEFLNLVYPLKEN